LIRSGVLERLLDYAVEIQQIPAPTFLEEKRSNYVLQQFKGEGLTDSDRDELGNVYSRLPGSASTRPIIVSAHLDTVFPLETNLEINRSSDRICGPGMGDNSLGVASLLALSWLLKESSSLKNDLWLVANVGEEGLGNLRGMKAVVEKFGSAPKAYIVVEGMALGSIYHRGLSVRRYRIQARTPGGHSWLILAILLQSTN
jgi:putative aminopeptidase FrvX